MSAYAVLCIGGFELPDKNTAAHIGKKLNCF